MRLLLPLAVSWKPAKPYLQSRLIPYKHRVLDTSIHASDLCNFAAHRRHRFNGGDGASFYIPCSLTDFLCHVIGFCPDLWLASGLYHAGKLDQRTLILVSFWGFVGALIVITWLKVVISKFKLFQTA